ncbi:MAG: hypothetical protein U9M90_00820 [Patescibacteria group bacterium]|nr:hypothetical protein [Patescibacteria group bacterium]
MQRIDIKKLTAKATAFFEVVGSYINLNTWYFTVLFFVGILIASLWTWWNCFQNPVPSSEILIRVEQRKENYPKMKLGTEEVITILQENRKRFDNPPFFGDQRELFWEIDPEDPKDPSSIAIESNEPGGGEKVEERSGDMGNVPKETEEPAQ